MNKEEFLQLADKIINGSASASEVTLFNAWYNNFTRNNGENFEDQPLDNEERLLSRIHQVLNPQPKKSPSVYRRFYFSAAASILSYSI